MSRLPPGLREIRFRVYPVLFGWYDTARGQDSLLQLGKIVEQAVQSCPSAIISITNTTNERLTPKCQEAADAILNRLQRRKEYQKRISEQSATNIVRDSRLSNENDGTDSES